MATFNQQNQTVGVQINTTEQETFKPTICIDFDGVLHSYTSGWKGAGNIPDEPVPGAIEWLTSLLNGGNVKPVIYSSRSKEAIGVVAMKTWLMDNGLDKRHIQTGALEFPTEKPAAFLTIDDRAIAFMGWFPPVDAMLDFKPWNMKDADELLYKSMDDMDTSELLQVLVSCLTGKARTDKNTNATFPYTVISRIEKRLSDQRAAIRNLNRLI
jgi:hypothetical protein